MPKLITPISFSDKLAVCEQIGQPEISDEVRQVITLPLADSQPVDGKPPAVGKFLQSDKHGALLRHFNGQDWENTEHTASGDITEDGLWFTEFSQKVYKVVVFCTYTMIGCHVEWATPDGTLIKALSFLISKQCDFVGTKFYYQTRTYIMGVITFDFYGFY